MDEIMDLLKSIGRGGLRRYEAMYNRLWIIRPM